MSYGNGNNYGNLMNTYTTPNVPTSTLPTLGNGTLNTNIILVQGEAGAKGFLLAPNNEVVLFDSESPIFYKKVMTPNGISFRRFKYEEIIEEDVAPKSPIMSSEPQTSTQSKLNIDPDQIVTWDALNKALPRVIATTMNQMMDKSSDTKEEVRGVKDE